MTALDRFYADLHRIVGIPSTPAAPKPAPLPCGPRPPSAHAGVDPRNAYREVTEAEVPGGLHPDCRKHGCPCAVGECDQWCYLLECES